MPTYAERSEYGEHVGNTNASANIGGVSSNASLADITAGQEARFAANTEPAIQKQLASLDSTAMIDDAIANNETAFQGSDRAPQRINKLGVILVKSIVVGLLAR